MACRAGRLLRALTGTSVRALSSSHRCRRQDSPSKLLSGTSEMRLASRRLAGWEVRDEAGQCMAGRSLRRGAGLGGAARTPAGFRVPWD